MDLALLLPITGIVAMAALGVLAFRETMALRRWDPVFFRRGLVAFRQDVPLSHDPASLPAPSDPDSGFFSWSVQWQRVTPLEVIFTAQTTNSPLLKGLLFFDASSHSLVVMGRVFWGTLPLFIVGFGLLAAFEGSPFAYAFLALLLFCVGTYVAELRRVRRILQRAAAVLLSEVKGAG